MYFSIVTTIGGYLAKMSVIRLYLEVKARTSVTVGNGAIAYIKDYTDAVLPALNDIDQRYGLG